MPQHSTPPPLSQQVGSPTDEPSNTHGHATQSETEAEHQQAQLEHPEVSLGKITSYDKIPHPWINTVLRAVKAPKLVRRTVWALIPESATELNVCTHEGVARIPIRMEQGLYQGDALSPLLFCLSVAPISWLLRETGAGFQPKYHAAPLTHLHFADDLKIYASSPAELEATVRKVEEVAAAVGMRLGLRKCTVAHMRDGREIGGGGVRESCTTRGGRDAGDGRGRDVPVPKSVAAVRGRPWPHQGGSE